MGVAWKGAAEDDVCGGEVMCGLHIGLYSLCTIGDEKYEAGKWRGAACVYVNRTPDCT